jgi:hypothetical protein
MIDEINEHPLEYANSWITISEKAACMPTQSVQRSVKDLDHRHSLLIRGLLHLLSAFLIPPRYVLPLTWPATNQIGSTQRE